MSPNRKQRQVLILHEVRRWFLEAAKHLLKKDEVEAEGCLAHAREHLGLLDNKIKDRFISRLQELPAYGKKEYGGEKSAPRVSSLLEHSPWSEWQELSKKQLRFLIESLSPKKRKRRQ